MHQMKLGFSKSSSVEFALPDAYLLQASPADPGIFGAYVLQQTPSGCFANEPSVLVYNDALT